MEVSWYLTRGGAQTSAKGDDVYKKTTQQFYNNKKGEWKIIHQLTALDRSTQFFDSFLIIFKLGISECAAFLREVGIYSYCICFVLVG